MTDVVFGDKKAELLQSWSRDKDWMFNENNGDAGYAPLHT